MKSKIATCLLLLLSSTFLHAIPTKCRCDSQSGSTLTVHQYFVGDQEGCCTGTAVDLAAMQIIFELNEKGVWRYVSESAVTGAAAQSACCPNQ
ncbi:MAG: hypothetical protein J0L99_00170 [Chitinophagales bacterium]|nr:hypothetical protein [Chitinophagales bacterium]